MASPDAHYTVSKYKVEWAIGDAGDVGQDTASFCLRVRDGLEVTCLLVCHRFGNECASCLKHSGFQQVFSYELSWRDRETR